MGPGPSPPTAAPRVEPSSNREPQRGGGAGRSGGPGWGPPVPARLHDSPQGPFLRCAAAPARRRAGPGQEVQHRQNPAAVPRRHLPRDPEPEKPERLSGEEQPGRAGLPFGQGPEDPAGHLQHQHVPAGRGGRHPAWPRGGGGAEGGQEHRVRAQGELQENRQAEPTPCPGTAPPQEEAAEGDREEGAAAGDVLGEALRPARAPAGLLGCLGDLPSPRPRGQGDRRGARSGFAADGALFRDLGEIQPRSRLRGYQGVPEFNSSSCFKRCPRDWPRCTGWVL